LEWLRLEHPDQNKEHTGLSLIRFYARVDTRDRPVYPRTGSVFNLDLELGFDVLMGKEEYQKGQLLFRNHLPLWGDLQLITALRIGISANLLPPSEKFSMGGSRSMYGYRLFELEGDKLLNANIGLQLKLPLHFYVAGRFDFGNVWGRWNQMRADDLLCGYGFSLENDSFLGPLIFSFGRSGKAANRFYLVLVFEF